MAIFVLRLNIEPSVIRPKGNKIFVENSKGETVMEFDREKVVDIFLNDRDYFEKTDPEYLEEMDIKKAAEFEEHF